MSSAAERRRTAERPEPEPPPLAAEIAAYLASMPAPPPSGVDARGRLLPVSDEELKARAERLRRTLEEIDRTAGESDSEEVWREVYRSIDAQRPHRPLFRGKH